MSSRPGGPPAIFIYRPGAIGDTILTLPALAAIRRRWPDSRLIWAGNAAMLPLVPADERLTADDRRLLPLFADPPRPWPGADTHIIFARRPSGLPGIQRDPLAAAGQRLHMVDWLVNAIDPSFPDRRPRIEAQPGDGCALVIHAGAGSPAKRWPADRFIELAQALHRPTAVIRGPADPPLALPASHDVWHNLPLTELARRLAGSELFVGNDSGISHLAAAAGVPTAVIYVATDPAIWGVRGRAARHLLGDVTVEQALACCEELLTESSGAQPPRE